MPNEAQNYLYILGEKNEVIKFQDIHKVNHSNGLFWDFGVSRKIIGNTNKERYEKWGTTRAGLLTCLDHKLVIETATTPCNTWLEYVICNYPKLKFVMYFIDEFGEEFYGSVVGENGSIIQNEYYDLTKVNIGEINDIYNNYVEKLLETHKLKR